MAVFWAGAGGHFIGWGPVLSGTQPTKNCFGRNSAPPASFRHFFRLIGTAFALPNFLTVMGGFTQVFRENRDLLVYGGVWALGEIPGPNQQKKTDPKKIEKYIANFIFRCGFKKYVFVKNGAILAISFSFSPLEPPSRGAH